ncbi:MAG: acyl-CoA thioesterase [Propionibacteriaceae bacterium]|jgi:acyl-CoA thioester hydrolase|nr:acyl-CoA thioesterase [Propionibacteriaceae bacterium]
MSETIEVPLRWGDLDAQGHINNARFTDYVQEARHEFLHSLTKIGDLVGGMVVVKQQVDYRAPARFSTTPIHVETSLSDVGYTNFELAFTLRQGETEVAVARTVMCPYNLVTGAPQRVSKEARQLMGEIKEPVEALRDIHWRPMNDNARATPMKVRRSDLDSYAHVNNTVFFDYIQEGRIAFTAAAAADMNDIVNDGYLWFVVRQDVNYVKPIQYRHEPYTVRTGVSHMGTTSLTFCSEIADPVEHKRFASACTVAVFADNHGRPIPVPQVWKDMLEQYSLM